MSHIVEIKPNKPKYCIIGTFGEYFIHRNGKELPVKFDSWQKAKDRVKELQAEGKSIDNILYAFRKQGIKRVDLWT